MSESWAVKYRPKTWSDITGNETAAKVLASAVKSNQIPPAVFLTGTRGSGKCFDKSEYVLTPGGIMRGMDLAPAGAFDHTGYFKASIPLINKDGQQEVSTEFFNNGYQNCIEITMKSGRQLHVTPNHPLYKYSLPNAGVFTAARDLVPGDSLAVLLNTRCFGDSIDISYAGEGMQMSHPDEMTEDLAFFMGLYTALHMSDVKWNKAQYEVLKSYRASLFPNYSRFTTALQLENFMNSLGVGYVHGSFEVPFTILKAPEHIQSAYMNGLVLFTGGYNTISRKWRISLFRELKLAHSIQVLFTNIGADSFIRRSRGNTYALEVSDICSLMNLAHFMCSDFFMDLEFPKGTRLINNSRRPNNNPVYIPDEIVSVDFQDRTTETIDFCMPFTHSFILNGVVSHNTSSARLYARSMLCDNLQEDGSPCNSCPSCTDFLAGKYEDYTEIDAASHNSVEGIRNLTKSLSFMPVRGKYRIVLLDECHALSGASANALLKTLEEPPEHVKFIFCTTDPQKVLDTIKSRTLIFNFTDIKAADIIKRLRQIASAENALIDDTALASIAQYANGGMRDAVMMMHQAYLMKLSSGEPVTPQDILEIAGCLSVNNSASILGAMLDGRMHTEEISSLLQKFSPQSIIKSCLSLLENILLLKYGVPASDLVQDDKMHVVLSLASKMSVEDVYSIFSILVEASEMLKTMSFVPASTLFSMKLSEASHRIAHNSIPVQDGGTPSSTKGSQHRSLLLNLKQAFGLYPVPNRL